jgi:hypothetical protein
MSKLYSILFLLYVIKIYLFIPTLYCCYVIDFDCIILLYLPFFSENGIVKFCNFILLINAVMSVSYNYFILLGVFYAFETEKLTLKKIS